MLTLYTDRHRIVLDTNASDEALAGKLRHELQHVVQQDRAAPPPAGRTPLVPKRQGLAG
jgi:hypothetical protein